MVTPFNSPFSALLPQFSIPAPTEAAAVLLLPPSRQLRLTAWRGKEMTTLSGKDTINETAEKLATTNQQERRISVMFDSKIRGGGEWRRPPRKLTTHSLTLLKICQQIPWHWGVGKDNATESKIVVIRTRMLAQRVGREAQACAGGEGARDGNWFQFLPASPVVGNMWICSLCPKPTCIYHY